jgi:ABC-2 type transport system permease protein
MIRIFDIALKDLLQFLRDRKTFLFLLIMPIAFTLLFGFAFGGFGGGQADPRLPVGFLDEDGLPLSLDLHDLLADSEVIRLVDEPNLSLNDMQAMIADDKLAAAIVIPNGYHKAILHGKTARIVLVADSASPAGITVRSQVLSAASRLDSAVKTAIVLERFAGDRAPFDYSLELALEAWKAPPIGVKVTTSQAIVQTTSSSSSLANTSPGMMLQFAIAGLLTSAQVIVNERKTRSLQRMLTTATRRFHILIGHYLAIFILLFVQFVILIGFGQFFLKLHYLDAPLATLLVAIVSALCIAALGLLIGTLAQTEEQAVTFSLVPMFVLAGLGGAWVPLEVIGSTFQFIGHLSPVAWAMDGFKTIIVRGLGVEAVLLPALALLGYATLFLFLAAWRFQATQEH